MTRTPTDLSTDAGLEEIVETLKAENAWLREELERAKCVHEWEWLGTSVDMSNVNRIRYRCSKCFLLRTDEVYVPRTALGTVAK
jgi:hypothetical protein